MDWIFQFGDDETIVAYQTHRGGPFKVLRARELMPYYPKWVGAWHEVVNAQSRPTPRGGASMSVDRHRESILIFGGQSGALARWCSNVRRIPTRTTTCVAWKDPISTEMGPSL